MHNKSCVMLCAGGVQRWRWFRITGLWAWLPYGMY